jgi:AraC-like DNA-binding protein
VDVTVLTNATTTSTADTLLTSALGLARSRPEELTVADLADHVGYSPFHFSRLFTHRLGIGPGRYLTALRIDRAKRLLLQDTDSIIDVATAVGFDSLSSFSRRFSATVGVPPGRLRRLAERISDRPPLPFSLLRPSSGSVRVDPHIWVGWFPQPAPIGLPRSGTLVSGVASVDLPLCPGAPHLLGFAVPQHADALDQLAPADPTVAVALGPLRAGSRVTLSFASAGDAARPVPLVTALPSLCTR